MNNINKIFNIIEDERKRQENSIELIASENFTSENVMRAQGSILTNKYAEGYPEKRYYGGCENVDKIEKMAIDSAKELFNCNYANVQPHSGSQANTAVFQALLKPNDKILGMKLDHGGHLTHGSSVNFSGKFYQSVGYGIEENGEIDYEKLRELAIKEKPKLIIAGFSAYSRILKWNKFREIANEINAYLLADISHVAGLVATDLYPSPFPYADVVTTTTHKTLRGCRGGLILTNDNVLSKKINSAIFPGIQGGPLMHIIAAKAITFNEALSNDFKVYQEQVLKNAKAMEKRFKEKGYNIISEKTENHLLLIDLRNKNITGKECEEILDKKYGITLNKNSIPNDPESPFVTSGIRIGTPAMTTKGFKEDEFIKVVEIIDSIINKEDENKIQQSIKELLSTIN